MRKRWIVALSPAAAVVALGLLVDAPDPASTPETGRVAYIKTPDRNRVLIYVDGGADRAEARRILERAPHTSGQVTAAYLYRRAESAPVLRQSESYLAAVDEIEASAVVPTCRLVIGPDPESRTWSGLCG